MIRDANRRHLIRRAWSVGITLRVVACAAQSKQQEQALQQPIRINGATAAGGLRMLPHEKAHVAQQIAMGVTAIAPAGLVAGVLTGTEHTNVQMATGDSNRMIDQQIADIKMTCGLP